MKSVCELILNLCSRAILEIDAVQTVFSLTPPQQLSVLGFCVFQTLIYLLIAVVISNSSATALNLSTLSADGLSLLGYYYILNKTFGVSTSTQSTPVKPTGCSVDIGLYLPVKFSL